ncbi:MAG TPA: 50S ribosomal protein L14 [Patescibacteria group bacterium]|nr:50S ribosomal protein L14 [Patescibacteria group bacterium]
MIQSYSRLKVADNTGAKVIMCIRPLGREKRAAELGDIIVGSVKSTAPQSNAKKKEVVRAVIVRQTKPFQRKDGTSIRFDDNAVVLLNPDSTPRGSRIFGPIARELRERGFTKIISMATEVV